MKYYDVLAIKHYVCHVTLANFSKPINFTVEMILPYRVIRINPMKVF